MAPRLLLAILVALALLPRRVNGAGLEASANDALSTSVVADLGTGARCTRLVATGDDLYVLDAAAEHVRRYVLDGLPYALKFTQIMRWREGDNGLIIGKPLDMSLSGGRLLTLDSLGSLWSYWGPSYSRALVPLRLQSNQGAVSALAQRGGALLLLDRDRRQVWSYAASGGGYDTVPRALLPRPLPALGGATRLAVTSGSLLASAENGAVLSIPWANPGAAARLPIPLAVTGVWASATSARFYATSAHELALVTPQGRIRWRAPVAGLGGQALRDVAMSPSGKIYALTDTRVLLVTGRVPAL